jgi:hypothetical protein
LGFPSHIPRLKADKETFMWDGQVLLEERRDRSCRRAQKVKATGLHPARSRGGLLPTPGIRVVSLPIVITGGEERNNKSGGKKRGDRPMDDEREERKK